MEEDDMSGAWYENSLLYNSYISTDEGGCKEDFREPQFIGGKSIIHY